MARKLIAPALLAAATLLSSACAKTVTTKGNVQWDEKASQELHKALHHTHEVANAGDIKSLKESYIGDEALGTFELDPDNATPVMLKTKTEIDAHLDKVNAGLKTQGTLLLDGPKMTCRATPTFGICTEQCTVRVKKADGSETVDHFFGSGTAVKVGDEWKWVHWHMSVGAPRENIKTATKVDTAPNQDHHGG